RFCFAAPLPSSALRKKPPGELVVDEEPRRNGVIELIDLPETQRSAGVDDRTIDGAIVADRVRLVAIAVDDPERPAPRSARRRWRRPRQSRRVAWPAPARRSTRPLRSPPDTGARDRSIWSP